MWHLEWGEDREFLEDLEESSGETPPALLRRPELEDYQTAILEGFFLLCPDRPLGMGAVGAIPTVAILAMAEIVGEEPRIFLSLCRALDGLYLERINTRKK